MAYKNKDWLQDQYWNKNRSSIKIASEFSLTPQAIRYWLRKFGIPRRGDSTFKGDKAKSHTIHAWLRNKYPPPEECQDCGKIKPRLYLANLKNHKYTRNIEDYKYLCFDCHQKLDGYPIKPYRFKKGKENISNIDHWRNRGK